MSVARARRSRLTARQVKQQVAIGQTWTDTETQRTWRLRNIYRSDEQVLLQSASGGLRVVRFGELGARYSHDEDGAA